MISIQDVDKLILVISLQQIINILLLILYIRLRFKIADIAK